MESNRERVRALLLRAVDGDLEAIREIVTELEARTGRDGVKVLAELMEVEAWRRWGPGCAGS